MRIRYANWVVGVGKLGIGVGMGVVVGVVVGVGVGVGVRIRYGCANWQM